MTDVRYTAVGDRRVTVDAEIRVIAPRSDLPGSFRDLPRYAVDLCQGFGRIGVANAYQFDAVVRHLAKGQWRLAAPLTGLDVSDVNDVDSIIMWDESQPPRIVFAGIVRRVPGVDGGTARRLTATGDEVEFVGVDLFGVLASRQVWPTPSTVPPWADGYDVRSGRGSTVAAAYIEANAGSSALSARQIAGLTVVDAGAGTSSTWSGRLQPLDEFVGRICRESGVSCRVSMTTPGEIVLSLTDPTDRSASLIITDQGDLEDLSRFVVPATASFVIGAGQGELTSRAFATADDGRTGLDRVEQVYENTNISTAAGLETATNTELALAGSDVSVDGNIAETAAQRLRYLDDYDLGDWLGVEVDGVRYRSQVEAVRFEINAERETVRPVLGRAATNQLLALTRQVDALGWRFDRQIA